MDVAVLDGHEQHASCRRHCAGWLQRVVKIEAGERIQYYHRQVTLMLLPGPRPGSKPLRLLLDCEPMLPGEDEVDCAMRLLTRALAAYQICSALAVPLAQPFLAHDSLPRQLSVSPSMPPPALGKAAKPPKSSSEPALTA